MVNHETVLHAFPSKALSAKTGALLPTTASKFTPTNYWSGNGSHTQSTTTRSSALSTTTLHRVTISLAARPPSTFLKLRTAYANTMLISPMLKYKAANG